MSTHRPCWQRLLPVPVALALALLAGMPTTGQSQPVDTTSRPGGLFDDIVDPALTRRALPAADILRIPGITTLRSRLVAIDFGRLAEARVAGGYIDTPTGTATPVTLTLNLFEDVVLPAVVERTAITASRTGYVVSGRLDGVEWGTWKLFVYGDQVVTGTVRIPSGSFNVRTVGGVHVISQIDTSSMPRFEDRVIPAPPDARPAPTDIGPDSRLDTTRTTADIYAESLIDIAVAYTEAAVAGAYRLKGEASIDGVIDEMIDNAHEAYERSGANLWLRLAWSGLLECSGTACSDEDEALDYIATRADLRTKYGADLLSWIVDIPRFAGVAHHGGYYSVVHYNQETDHYTFAHELGHNMYLNHDRWTVVNVPEGGGTLNDPYPYSHGYISTNCGWRTIMAYERRCAKPVRALRNFSNPNKVHDDGERMGVFGDSPVVNVDGPANAVRSLNEKRREVARYWHPSTDMAAVVALHYSIGAHWDPFPLPLAFRVHFYDGRATLLDNCCRISSGAGVRYGELPGYIGTLTELQRLSVVVNGRLPTTLGNLTKLGSLHISDVTAGGIPATLGNLSKLWYLNLGGGGLAGEIPAELGNLSKLEYLDLRIGRLTGAIPAELGNLSKLETLQLHSNRLTGVIPAELGNLSKLEALDLWDNRLTGAIPAGLGKLSNLTWLRLATNELTGSIPAELGRLSNLKTLELRYNRLTGAIPAELGNLSNLEYLHLMNNRLTGAIPAALAHLTKLNTLSLDIDTGLCLAQSFPLNSAFGRLARDQGVPVCEDGVGSEFTDDPLVAGVTAIRAVHFLELRERIARLRVTFGLGRFAWTDATLTPGVTPVKSVHTTQLRTALALPVAHNFLLDFLPPLRYGGRHGDSESGLTYSTRQPRPPARRAGRGDRGGRRQPRSGRRPRL